ncbi:MAG: hypothetical protein FJ038_13965 [Chloroflexi bacterium]|nr:hypothetical protein [Chloroflexota bacterium]
MGAPLEPSVLRDVRGAWAGAVVDEFVIGEAEQIVRAAWLDDGYATASVTASFDTGREKVLRLHIEPGTRITGNVVTWQVDPESLRPVVERWVGDNGFDDDIWRQPGEIARALEEYLRGLGYLIARVTVSGPDVSGSTAMISGRVSGGPLLELRDVRFDGAERLDGGTLLEAAALRVPATFSPGDVAAARDRVVRRYRQEGFSGVRVTSRLSVDEAAARVEVSFDVVEGPRQMLREIVVTGARTIDEQVVVRDLGLAVGEPLGSDAWLQARRRVFESGLFRRVDVTPEPMAMDAPPEGEQPTRLRVTVEEWPAVRFRYGFQVAEVRPEGELSGRDLSPGLRADVLRRTLGGRALTLGGSGEWQLRHRAARVFAVAPTLFGRRIRSAVSAESSRDTVENASFVTDQTSVSWEQRMPVWSSWQVSYRYAYERQHTYDTAESDNPFFPPFDITVNVARLSASAIYDTRNDPTDTRRGLFVSGSLEYAPEVLGSDIRFIRTVLQGYYFRPWRGLVFASGARVGLGRALAGQELIASERFYAGGARSVRGVLENGLGDLDFLGDPVGGAASLVLNQEVRFPIYKWVGGVGFVDAGNVFARSSELGLGDLVSASGAGLRVTTPFGIVRVDYGRTWSGGPGRWYFGIGQAY